MVKFLELLLQAMLLVISSIFVWNKLSSTKTNYYNLKNICVFLICCIFVAINDYPDNNVLKPLIATIIMLVYCILIYKDEIKQRIIMPIYSQVVILVSEIIFDIFALIIKNVNEIAFKELFFNGLIPNLIIAIIVIFLSQLKIVKKIYDKIVNSTNKLKKIRILLYSLIIVAVADALTAFVYYKASLILLLTINSFIILVYAIFVYFYLKTNNNYAKVYDKYNMTLNSLKEYEDILSRYRVSNHENKNQLLTIRGMVKNKKVTSYIDEIIENKLKDNEKLMFESLVIPEGGLRGLIYSKMLLMKENNIDYDLCIDNALKTTDLSNISDELMLNICNIVGVYLDNAIEAVKDLDEKYIVIEMYLDKTLNIAITNNYDENINIDNMDNVGYSTKGGNHGYGLSLVKEIIDKNKNIENVRRISDDEFTQEIKIKM